MNASSRVVVTMTSLALLCRLAAAPVAVQSGTYQTLPGATAIEFGEWKTNRVVPVLATLTLDLEANPPSLTATMPTAVFEPHDLTNHTVRSSSGVVLPDGAYRFSGPFVPGTQYLFDWRFSPSTNGTLVWNGTTAWVGGHIWQVSISNVTIVPVPYLTISRAGPDSVRLWWSGHFPNYSLESAPDPSGAWMPVKNSVTSSGTGYAVTIRTESDTGFFRLHNTGVNAVVP